MSRLHQLDISEGDGEERELRSSKTIIMRRSLLSMKLGGKAKQGGVMAGLLQGRESR